MIQEIITTIIVISAVSYTIYSFIQFFKNMNKDTLCNCGGCHSKELQEIIKKSKQKKMTNNPIKIAQYPSASSGSMEKKRFFHFQ